MGKGDDCRGLKYRKEKYDPGRLLDKNYMSVLDQRTSDLIARKTGPLLRTLKDRIPGEIYNNYYRAE